MSLSEQERRRSGKQGGPYSITGLQPYPWIRWWYFLAAPHAPMNAEELPLKDREFLRRGKLTSIALLIELIDLVIQAIPASHDGTNAFPFILLSIAFLVVAVILNRAGKLLFAGLLVMIVLEAGVISVIALPPAIPLTFAQYPFIFVLVEALLISVLLFPAWAILVVAAINMIVTVLLLNLLPRTTDFQNFVQAHSGPVFGIPLTLQLLGALISYIVITSLQESLVRADRAEEVTKLQQVMAEQTRNEIQTKRQLESNIEEIVAGLTRFSNGDNQARISLEQGNPLWSISANINNMMSRFVRLREQERPQEQTVMALRAYLRELQMARINGMPLPEPRTGTEVDVLVREVVRYSLSAQRPQQYHRPAQSYIADGEHSHE